MHTYNGDGTNADYHVYDEAYNVWLESLHATVVGIVVDGFSVEQARDTMDD